MKTMNDYNYQKTVLQTLLAIFIVATIVVGFLYVKEQREIAETMNANILSTVAYETLDGFDFSSVTLHHMEQYKKEQEVRAVIDDASNKRLVAIFDVSKEPMTLKQLEPFTDDSKALFKKYKP
ncbi:hypothetical protein GOP80_06045 [Planococcaceae bacterium Storch 2/2-2]|nr:hypothetical protein [Planococcaceae bacterium Storch 2/2-2]